MAIRFQCECGRDLAAKDQYAGRRLRCPDCGAVLTIPDTVEPPPVVFVAPPMPDPEPEPEPTPATVRLPPTAPVPQAVSEPSLTQHATPWRPGDEARFQELVDPARERVGPWGWLGGLAIVALAVALARA